MWVLGKFLNFCQWICPILHFTHPWPRQGLPPPCTAARASWLPSPFHQQRLQDIYSSLGAFREQNTSAYPQRDNGITGKNLGRSFVFVISSAGRTELGREVLLPALSSPTAVMVGRNTSSAIYRPSLALEGLLLERPLLEEHPPSFSWGQRGKERSSAEEENHGQFWKEPPPLSLSFIWGLQAHLSFLALALRRTKRHCERFTTSH